MVGRGRGAVEADGRRRECGVGPRNVTREGGRDRVTGDTERQKVTGDRERTNAGKRNADELDERSSNR